MSMDEIIEMFNSNRNLASRTELDASQVGAHCPFRVMLLGNSAVLLKMVTQMWKAVTS
jgi:hypothetical protein